MRLMITGAGGFLGSHIVDEAAKLWPGDIIAVANYHASGNIGWAPKGENVRVVRHDIRDTVALRQYAPDIIINAAARTSVPYSFDAPLDNWEVNANAVARMIHTMPHARVVQISTSEVFNGQHPPYFESTAPCPSTPYGASKAAAESVVTAAGHTVCRVFNLFGPRQSPRTIIPRMALQAWQIKRGQRERASLYGPNNRQGQPYSRAFLFVHDVARLIATRVIDDPRPLIQLSCGESVKIADLWPRVCRAVGVDPALIDWTELPGNATTVWKLYGKSSEGYTPRGLDESTLSQTVLWYGENGDKFGPITYD